MEAIIVLWLLLSALAAAIAYDKGRSARTHFFLALLFSPLIGLLIAMTAKPDTAKLDTRKLAKGNAKRCPACAEIIKPEAVVCRYCGADVTLGSGAPSGTSPAQTVRSHP